MPFSQSRAPKSTRVGPGETDTEIESGDTITVYSIVCSNTTTSAETVTIEEAGTTTIKVRIRVPADNTTEVTTVFLADKGLQVTTPANTDCVIFHSQPGS